MNFTSLSNDPTRDIKNFEEILGFCRICMANNMTMTNIFGETNRSIVEKIEFCTGLLLKQEDGLPMKICINCLGNLSVAHNFKTSCLLSDQRFRILLTSRIKSELPDVYQNNEYLDNYIDENDYGNDEKVQIKVEELLDQNNVTRSSRKCKKVDNKLQPFRKTSRRSDRKVKERISKSLDEKTQASASEPVKNVRRTRKMKFTRLYCVQCDLKFLTRHESLQHRNDVHKADNKWICEICGKSYSHQGSLYSHTRAHFPPSFACAHCDYRTGHKSDLVKHLHIHFGQKFHKCAVCARAFTTRSNLCDHQRRQHTRERRFACALCPKMFYDRTKLNRHTDSHNAVKRFKCDVCDSCFTRRCYWKKHLEKVHGVVVPPQRPGRQRMYDADRKMGAGFDA